MSCLVFSAPLTMNLIFFTMGNYLRDIVHERIMKQETVFFVLLISRCLEEKNRMMSRRRFFLSSFSGCLFEGQFEGLEQIKRFEGDFFSFRRNAN